MRAVLDTNVFVSGLFWTGTPGRLLEAWSDGRWSLVVSREIIEEYFEVCGELAGKHPSVNPRPTLDLVTSRAELCEPSSLPQGVCRDSDDDKFIACALGGAVDVVVTGDKDLLV